ncbi:MAG: geranylgeranylglycerol-phosphate geranylgeranyltransferase [Zestosphaera sp.]
MTSFNEKITAYLELLRMHNVAVTLLTTLIGWLTVRVTAPSLGVESLMIPVLAVGLISSAGYVINDYFDVEVDRVNKPYRPIPSGRVSTHEALTLSIILFTAGGVSSLFAGPYTITFVVLNALAVFLYSYRIKELGLIGNVVVSLEGAFTIVLGALTPSELLNNLSLVKASLMPALYAFTLLLAREIVKTIEDLKADEVRDVKSLPRIAGVRVASLTATVLLLFIVCISPLPYLAGYGHLYLALALTTDVLILYAVSRLIKLGSLENPESAAAKLRTVLKISIFTGTTAFAADLMLRTILSSI